MSASFAKFISSAANAANKVASQALDIEDCCICAEAADGGSGSASKVTDRLLAKGKRVVGAEALLKECACCNLKFCENHREECLIRGKSEPFRIPLELRYNHKTKKTGRTEDDSAQNSAETRAKEKSVYLYDDYQLICNRSNAVLGGRTCLEAYHSFWQTAFIASMETALRGHQLKLVLEQFSSVPLQQLVSEHLTYLIPTAAVALAGEAQVAGKNYYLISDEDATRWFYTGINFYNAGGLNYIPFLGSAKYVIDVVALASGGMAHICNALGIDGTLMKALNAFSAAVVQQIRSAFPEFISSDKTITRTELVRFTKKVAITLYYLYCQHNLEHRHRIRCRITSEELSRCRCSNELIVHALRFLGPAAWLYHVKLPGTHKSDAWSNWYLQQVVKGTSSNFTDGWVLVGVSHHNKRVPTFEYTVMQKTGKGKQQHVKIPKECFAPAFALLIREVVIAKEHEQKRTWKVPAADGLEALVVIRGTTTIYDAIVDMDGSPENFTYSSCSSSSNEGREVTAVSGQVHGGMLRSARALLEHCALQRMLDQLVERGCRSIKIAGHSLGGGTAALLALLLRNHYLDGKQNGFGRALPDVMVEAVTFGTPSMVSESLSVAAKQDEVVVSLINKDDIIPRITTSGLRNLTREVMDFMETACKQHYTNDVKELKARWKAGGKSRQRGKSRPSSAAVAPSQEENRTVDSAPSPEADALASEAEAMRGMEDFSSDINTPLVAAARGSNSNDGVSTSTRSNAVTPESELFQVHTEITEDLPNFVVPGRIIYIFFNKDGAYEASEVDHDLPSLCSMKLVDSAIVDHSTSAYLRNLRNIRFNRQVSTEGLHIAHPPQFSDIGTPGSWTPCEICGEDCTINHSTTGISARAAATFNCAACGCVACVACAPAGDQVPGEGINTKETLPDFRIPLPQLGITEPQRVCVRCYFSCF